ncbi:hypothetical protein DFH11DRAFT_1640112 [Phellopilus nigrolimitatus]|nr:hypothetical protein DFH11DRAFT_1640112 [Phellopilus nigrolimitatus]
MPCLRKLTINDAYMPTRSLPFYESWTLPNLKYLGFTNFIPKPVFRQNLSCCHMKFIEFFEPEELKHFLQSLTSLETLEIELVDLSVDDEDNDDEENDGNDNSVQEDLSSISSFSFSVIGETSVPFTTRVLEAIHPKVTEMLFTIVHPKCDNRDDYSKIHSRRACLLEAMQHFPTLKKLHLHFSGPDDSYYIDLGEILPLMPRLETLRIEAPRHSLMPLHNYTPARRRAIRFCNRDSLYLGRRKAGCDAVVYNNVVIGRFEVVGCCLDDEEIFRGAFPNSEVVWIP